MQQITGVDTEKLKQEERISGEPVPLSLPIPLMTIFKDPANVNTSRYAQSLGFFKDPANVDTSRYSQLPDLSGRSSLPPGAVGSSIHVRLQPLRPTWHNSCTNTEPGYCSADFARSRNSPRNEHAWHRRIPDLTLRVYARSWNSPISARNEHVLASAEYRIGPSVWELIISRTYRSYWCSAGSHAQCFGYCCW